MPREPEPLFEFLDLKNQSGIKQRIKNHNSDFRLLPKSKAAFDDLSDLLFSLTVLKSDRGNFHWLDPEL